MTSQPGFNNLVLRLDREFLLPLSSRQRWMSTVACFSHFNGLWGSDCRFRAPPQIACFPGYSYMLHCRLINFIHLISLQKYWQVYKPPHKLSFGHHTSLVCQEAVPLDTPVITYDTQLINGINGINSIILWL